jgi:hypothetical protein
MGKVKPTRDMELGRHARKAIRAIEDRGHTVRTEETDKGQVCLIGAVRKVVAPMGSVKAAGVVNDFNIRFGEWMKDNYPADADVAYLVEQFTGPVTGFSYSAPPATTWNDRVLLHGEEACAWLGKFADAMDPQ